MPTNKGRAIKGNNAARMNESQLQLLNIQIDNVTSQELLERFKSGFLVTPNADHMIKLQKDRRFFLAYETAEFKVCDSRILYLLTKVLFPDNALREQITGSDFFPKFCHYHAKKPESAKIFLLGGTEQSVRCAQDRINEKTRSEVIVGGYSPPFGFEKSPEQTEQIINMISQSGADTLAIGVGAPKQELWIYEHRAKLKGIRRFLAIGATIEFESNNLKRAPKWMTTAGLEWLYRLWQEPKRLAKRYLVDDIPIFFYLLKQRLGLYRDPWTKPTGKHLPR